MIKSDCKSQSYAHLMVFNKMAAKPRWPPKMPRKNNSALDLNMPHLVWKFYGKSCFSFWDMVRQLKKVDKKCKNTKRFHQMAVSLRWPPRSTIKSAHSLVYHMFHLVWKFHEESSFSFWDLVRQLKKVDPPKNNNSQKRTLWKSRIFTSVEVKLKAVNKMAAKPRWLPKKPWKNNCALDLNMPHLVWKFYGKSCFSF